MKLKLPTPEELQAIYQNDLIPSFPPSELKPLSHIQNMWKNGTYLPFCLYADDESGPVGVCFLWLGDPGWALLDYLCVTERHRNDGFGSEILRLMRQALPDTVIFGESEAPEHAPDPAMAVRRLGFYARNHARTAGFDTSVFGVHYKILYWADGEIRDEELMQQNIRVYRGGLKPDVYDKFIRIPYDPARGVEPVVPWAR